MGLFRTFGRNFNPQFVWYRRWFEGFVYLLMGDGDGALWKEGTNILK